MESLLFGFLLRVPLKLAAPAPRKVADLLHRMELLWGQLLSCFWLLLTPRRLPFLLLLFLPSLPGK
jgi:hypothetical protein